jgi:hypothetical protein
VTVLVTGLPLGSLNDAVAERMSVIYIHRCIRCINIPQHSEPAVWESNFIVLDVCIREGGKNSYTITLDEVGSDVAPCLSVSIQGRECPCDWYDLIMLAFGIMEAFMVLLDECTVPASHKAGEELRSRV